VGVDNLYILVNWRGRGLLQFFDSMVFKRGDRLPARSFLIRDKFRTLFLKRTLRLAYPNVYSGVILLPEAVNIIGHVSSFLAIKRFTSNYNFIIIFYILYYKEIYMSTIFNK
jgi:hypothetical protein